MRGKLFFGVATAALMFFGLAPAALAQDQPGDASTTATLTPGQAVNDEFSPAGDIDWYRLRVETGHRYTIALDGVPDADGAAADPMLSIYDAQGNQLAFNDDAGGSLNSALQYIPSQSGVVFVEARTYSDQDSGPYTLSVSADEIPPDDVGNDSSTRARASAGRDINGSLEYEGDVDWYRFSARGGYRYTVTLAGRGDNGVGDPFLRLLDRDGADINMNDDDETSLNSRLEFVQQTNADVFIEARAYADAYAGDYTLRIESEPLPRDDYTGDHRTRGRIEPGQTVTSALNYPSDRDAYRVRLTEGESYRFTLVGAGDNPVGDPYLRLLDAAGEEIAADDDGGGELNSYLEFTAPTTGNYYIQAGAFADAYEGGYTLTARAGDIPADASTDAALSPGGDYREGVLAPAGDRDWYRVDLSEGQAMRVYLASASSSDALDDPYLVLYGPDGSEVARDDDSGDGLNALLEHQATATGPHYVEVRGFGDMASGRYAVTVIPGEIGDNADTADYLMAGGEGRVSVIGGDGDVDWFTVEMVEGRPYRFGVQGVEPNPLVDPMLTLYDSRGNQVLADDDGGTGFNAYLSYTSVTGGPHFVAVSGYGGATGRYYVSAIDTDVPGHVNTDENLDAAAGDSRAASIEIAGDLDYFRVMLDAGVRYTIDVRGVGDRPLADPFVAIVDPSNARLTFDDDSGDGRNARLRFTPEQTGEYYIQASGLGDSTGSYEVTIVRQ